MWGACTKCKLHRQRHEVAARWRPAAGAAQSASLPNWRLLTASRVIAAKNAAKNASFAPSAAQAKWQAALQPLIAQSAATPGFVTMWLSERSPYKRPHKRAGGGTGLSGLCGGCKQRRLQLQQIAR